MGDLRVSVRLPSSYSADALWAAVAAIDAGSVYRCWFPENPYQRSAFIAASVIGQSYPDLRLGIGTVSVRARHPAMLVQDALSAAEFARSPLGVGVAIGLDSHRRELGLPEKSGLELLTRTVEALRRGQRGDPVVEHVDGSVLSVGPSAIETFVGAIGPKTLRLGLRDADGVILSLGAGTGYYEWVSERILPQVKSTGSSGPGLVAYVLFGGAGDPEVLADLRIGVGALLKEMSDWGPLRRLAAGTVSNASFEQMKDMTPQEIAIDLVDDRVLGDLAVWGDPTECAQQLRGLAALGITEIAFGFGSWLKDIGEAVQVVNATAGLLAETQ